MAGSHLGGGFSPFAGFPPLAPPVGSRVSSYRPVNGAVGLLWHDNKADHLLHVEEAVGSYVRNAPQFLQASTPQAKLASHTSAASRAV
eukprot:1703131-Prymnesium_polylepis.1